MKTKEIQRRLNEIYSLVPNFNCDRCGQCCGPIHWGLSEDIIIREFLKENKREYIKWNEDDYINNELRCPYYNREKNICTIYQVRPLICRLQGVVKELPCPNKIPNKILPRQTTDEMWRIFRKLEKELDDEKNNGM